MFVCRALVDDTGRISLDGRWRRYFPPGGKRPSLVSGTRKAEHLGGVGQPAIHRLGCCVQHDVFARVPFTGPRLFPISDVEVCLLSDF